MTTPPPTIKRTAKKSQTDRITKTTNKNITYIKKCLKSTGFFENIYSICDTEKIENIFVIDGPNIGYHKSHVFESRERYLTGKNFYKFISKNTATSEKNLHIVVSQKDMTAFDDCNDILEVFDTKYNQNNYFVHVRVSCYDETTKKRCMFSNEVDDFVRKYISIYLAKHYKKAKKYIPIYEISNDLSRNWETTDKITLIRFPTSLLKTKPTKPTKTTKTKWVPKLVV